jgi:phytoene synthase
MNPSITMEHNVFCSADSKTITSRSKSSFSSSFFFLPKSKQIAMQRVYAFFRTIDDVVDEEPDPTRQREHLAFWKQRLIDSQTSKSDIPILNELAETIRHFDIPIEYFLKLIEGCEMDLQIKRYENFTQLYEYCYRVASMVGLVCMRIFEYHSPTSDQMAIDLGIALQLTNIIRDVGIDLQKGRIYLPAEDLNRFGVSDLDLQLSKSTPQYYQLMEFQYNRALNYYDKASLEFSKDKDNKLLAAKIMSHVYKSLLIKIREARYPNLKIRLRFSFIEKMKLLVPVLLKSYF